MRERDDCDYISISNADNVYGTDVIKQVLEHAQSLGTEMILNPIDSRNFAEQG